jgi:hypothetical protein
MVVKQGFFREMKELAKQGYPEFAVMVLKSDIQKEVWDAEHIEKETSALPQEALIRVAFDRKRVEALRHAEKKLHNIKEKERKALKKVM